MRIAAAAPAIPWTDLAYSLEPNGRTLDYTITGPTDDLAPIGVDEAVVRQRPVRLGSATGYYAPPGVDPGRPDDVVRPRQRRRAYDDDPRRAIVKRDHDATTRPTTSTTPRPRRRC